MKWKSRMEKYAKEKYITLYEQMGISSLNKKGFGRDFRHDYYVCGYYPVSAMVNIQMHEHQATLRNIRGEIGLYFHYPACKNRCIYCHFYKNNYRVFKLREAEYVNALRDEMDRTIKGKPVRASMIYFGGGRPSLYDNENLDRLMDAIGDSCEIISKAEVKFEIYPNDYRPLDSFKKKLEVLRKIKTSSLIIDMQSLHDKILRSIGRRDTNWNNFKEILNICRGEGFNDFHTTLLIGLPYQSWEIFAENLKCVVELDDINMINTYIVFTKPNDPYLRWRIRSPEVFPSYQETDMMLLFARDYLKQRGFIEGPMYFFYRQSKVERYKLKNINISNYIGFGAASISMLKAGSKEYHYMNIPNYRKYIDFIGNGQIAAWVGATLDEEETFIKDFIFTLYNQWKVDLHHFVQKHGINVLKYYIEPLSFLRAIGLVEFDQNHIWLTSLGVLRAEKVMYHFASEYVRSMNNAVSRNRDKLGVNRYSYFPTISNHDMALMQKAMSKI